MFCSRCGKRVLDSMLFCPFCGAEIIIPDQDSAPAAPVTTPVEPEPVPEAPVVETAVPEPEPEPEPERPAPLIDDDMAWADPPEEEPEPTPEPEPERAPDPKPEPVREDPWESAGPQLRRRPSTVPVPDVPPTLDMFMDDEEEEEDDFDAFEEEAAEAESRARQRRQDNYRRYRDDDDDEDDDDDDDDEEGFFTRHLRGIVGLVLLLALLGGLAFYAMTDVGQGQLAKVNVTLPFIKAEAYSRLGYEAYQEGRFAESAAYYERALSREPESYNYASSAAMAYISDNNTDKAAELLRRCAELEPKRVEPYIYLLNLYPDPNTRPWEITRLVEQGYQETGDGRLKID